MPPKSPMAVRMGPNWHSADDLPSPEGRSYCSAPGTFRNISLPCSLAETVSKGCSPSYRVCETHRNLGLSSVGLTHPTTIKPTSWNRLYTLRLCHLPFRREREPGPLTCSLPPARGGLDSRRKGPSHDLSFSHGRADRWLVDGVSHHSSCSLMLNLLWYWFVPACDPIPPSDAEIGRLSLVIDDLNTASILLMIAKLLSLVSMSDESSIAHQGPLQRRVRAS
jgi:hypothetical protein